MPVYPGAVTDLQVQADGTIKDLATGAQATINRLGPKMGLVDGRYVMFDGALTNLIKNSQLLTNPTTGMPWNWTVPPNTTTRTASVETDAEGINRFKVVFNEDSSDYVVEQVVLNSPTVGKRYVYSCDIEVQGLVHGGTRPSIEIHCMGGATQYYGTYTPAVAGDQAKKRYYLPFDVPTGTTSIRVRFRRVNLGPVTATVWWSRPQFEEMPAGWTLGSNYLPTAPGATASKTAVLAAEKYPSGPGYWARVEGDRYNYFCNSFLDVDSNRDGVGDWVGQYHNLSTPPTWSLEQDALFGRSQRLRYTGRTGDNSYTGMQLTTLDGSFVAGDPICVSFWYKLQQTGTTPTVYVSGRTSADVLAGRSTSNALVNTTEWRFAWFVLSAAEDSCSKATAELFFQSVGPGDTVDFSICCINIEKATFPSSFIPTRGAAALRPRDDATHPVPAGLPMDLSVLGVGGARWSLDTPSEAFYYLPPVDPWPNGEIYVYKSGQNTVGTEAGGSDGVARWSSRAFAQAAADHTPKPFMVTRQGRTVTAFADGLKGASATLTADPTGVNTIARIGGSTDAGTQSGAYVHRIVLVPRVLSDEDGTAAMATLIAGLKPSMMHTVKPMPGAVMGGFL